MLGKPEVQKEVTSQGHLEAEIECRFKPCVPLSVPSPLYPPPTPPRTSSDFKQMPRRVGVQGVWTEWISMRGKGVGISPRTVSLLNLKWEE